MGSPLDSAPNSADTIASPSPVSREPQTFYDSPTPPRSSNDFTIDPADVAGSLAQFALG